jgi:hypothetical protein
MLSPVQLDREPNLGREEVDDERPDRVLTAEANA